MPVLPNRLSRMVQREVLLKQERRRQIRGLTWLAIALLIFSVARAGLHVVFTPGWWRLW